MIVDRVRVLFQAIGGSRFNAVASQVAGRLEALTSSLGSLAYSAVIGAGSLKDIQRQEIITARRARFLENAYTRLSQQGKLTATQSAALQTAIGNLHTRLEELSVASEVMARQMGTLRKAFLYAGFGAWITGAVFRHFGSQINRMVEETVERYAEWDWHLTRTQTLLQANSKSMATLTNAIKSWATEGIYSLKEITELTERLALAGFTLNEIMSATPAILQMATMEGMELSEAANIAAATMRAYNYEAKDMAAVANAMALASARSAVEVHDLGESLKYSGALAGTLRLSLLETNAVLAVAGQQYIRGGKSGRYLSQAFDKLAKTGYNLDRGLLPVLRRLHSEVQGMGPTARLVYLQTLVGRRAARLLAAVLGEHYDELKDFMKLQSQAIVVQKLQNKYGEEGVRVFEQIWSQVAASKDPMKALREEFDFSRLEAEAFYTILQMGNEVMEDTVRNWNEILTAQKVAHNQLTTLTASLRRLNETWNVFYMTYLEPVVPLIKVVNEVLRNMTNIFRQLPGGIRFVTALLVILSGIFLANAGAILYLIGAISLLFSSLVQIRMMALLTGETFVGLSGAFSAAGLSAANFFRVVKWGLRSLGIWILILSIIIELLILLQEHFHIFDPILKWFGLLKSEAKETAEAINSISFGTSPGGLVDVIKYLGDVGRLSSVFDPLIRNVQNLAVHTTTVSKGIKTFGAAIQPIQAYPEAIAPATQIVKHETYISPTVEVNINGAEIVDIESLSVFKKVVQSAVEEALDEVIMEVTP